jgi:hypothetical protein
MNVEAVPEDRPLREEEATLVRWLLFHGNDHAARYLDQLNHARVSSRCSCGCASVDFAVGGKLPTEVNVEVLSDFEWQDATGARFGVFVFARGGILAGLEVYSQDGLKSASYLPTPELLQRHQPD